MNIIKNLCVCVCICTFCTETRTGVSKHIICAIKPFSRNSSLQEMLDYDDSQLPSCTEAGEDKDIQLERLPKAFLLVVSKFSLSLESRRPKARTWTWLSQSANTGPCVGTHTQMACLYTSQSSFSGKRSSNMPDK